MADSGGPVTDNPIINAESQSGTVIAICVAFSAASAILLGMRLYTRVRLLRQAGADDITIVIAEVRSSLRFHPASFCHGQGEVETFYI